MIDVVEPLVLDLLEWIGREPRAYSEALVFLSPAGRGYLQARRNAPETPGASA